MFLVCNCYVFVVFYVFVNYLVDLFGFESIGFFVEVDECYCGVEVFYYVLFFWLYVWF